MSASQSNGAPLGALPLPNGVTEIQFADALLEFARLFLEQEPIDVQGAAAMIKAARMRMAVVGRGETT